MPLRPTADILRTVHVGEGKTLSSYDIAVIGGGLVGSATAYGLARQGMRVIVLDEGDIALRASRANFALVWVQGKGDGMPEYAAWARLSAEIWHELAAELMETSGVDVFHGKPGGLKFVLDAEEKQAYGEQLERIRSAASPPGFEYEFLDRKALHNLVPPLGPDVLGAYYSPHDGHCNSLFLLRALHAGLLKRGGTYRPHSRVDDIERTGGAFVVRAGSQRIHAGKVILAAGHGNVPLAPKVGLDVPIKPSRGQVMVTERFAPMLRYPTHLIRQTAEGSFMMGDTKEDVGFNVGTTLNGMQKIGATAVRVFPFLARARIVRVWSGIRIMPPDGFPIYDQSQSHPGAFTVNCHSGVSLAAAHVLRLAPHLAKGELPDSMSCFSAQRFLTERAA